MLSLCVCICVSVCLSVDEIMQVCASIIYPIICSQNFMGVDYLNCPIIRNKTNCKLYNKIGEAGEIYYSEWIPTMSKDIH